MKNKFREKVLKQRCRPRRKKKEEREDKDKKQSNEKEIEEFLSDEGFELMEKKILHKGFIGERGFKKLISPFKELIEKRSWETICEHKPPRCATLVREFYSNIVDRKGTQCYVRGKWVSFHRDKINQLLKLGKLKDGEKFKKLKENPNFQNICEVLTIRKGEWKGNTKTPYESIARGSLTKEAKVWFYSVSSVLMPSKHLSIVRQDEAVLLYAILKGYKINLGRLIEKSILSYQSSNFWGHLPHPAIVTYLCIKGGVTFNRDEEERCPKTPPLTLTAITKPTAIKGKKKLKEAMEERRENETELEVFDLNVQALVLST